MTSAFPIRGAVLLVVLMIVSWMSHGQDPYQLKLLNRANGLSNDEVTSITQDKQGFIWIGTRGGLNKYDGHEFVTYQTENDGLPSSSIETLFVDSHGMLWIGTKNAGLARFNPETEQFTTFSYNPQNAGSLGENRIVQVFEDKRGDIWAVGHDQGIYRQTSAGSFENHLEHLSVRKVVQDDRGFFWIAAEYTGLVLYDPQSRDAHTVLNVASGITTLEMTDNIIHVGTWREGYYSVDISEGYFKNPVITQRKVGGAHTALNDTYSLHARKNGELWVGTWGKGIRIIKEGRDIQHFSKSYTDKKSLSNDIVLTIFEDKCGLIWVGTDGGGVNIFRQNNSGFHSFTFDYFNANSLSSEVVISVLKRSTGEVLVGTKGGGVNNIDLANREVHRLNHPGLLDHLYNDQNNISALLEDSYGNLWVGDLDFGLYFIPHGKIEEGNYEVIRPEAEREVTGIKITTIGEFKPGVIWVGTQRNGINKIELSSQGTIDTIYHDPISAFGEQTQRISAISGTPDGHLWVGTYSGVLKYDPSEITKPEPERELPQRFFPDKIVTCVYQTNNQVLWVGTPNGLVQVSPDGISLKTWTQEDGLSSNYIQSIAGVKRDSVLWVATSDGLNVLDIESGAINSYSVDDGLIGDYFSPNASYNDGSQLFFGTTRGLVYFNPDSLKLNRDPAVPQFTALVINDDIQVEVGESYFGNRLLSKSIDHTKELVFNHQIRKFTISFSTQDYFSEKHAQYAYQLLGYDSRWINRRSANHASFTNLDPGTYTFRVKSLNLPVNSQSDVLEMTIHILPPPWATWWAYSIYLIAGLCFIGGLIWLITGQANLKNKLKVEKVMREKEHELHQMKLRFFTNISHELRTPLTLISAPLDEILSLEGFSSLVKEKAHLIKRNVKSLLRLSDQLITFRKVETNKMDLHLSKVDLVDYCREIYRMFKLGSGDDHYVFEFCADVKECEAYVDTEKLEIILLNLISNAVKFSQPEGRIAIRVSRPATDFVSISISDQGVGISDDRIAQIFERFYQLGNNSGHSGVGIGLALVQSLVQLHQGRIEVESKEGHGSTFRVELPLGDQLLKADYTQLATQNKATLRTNYWLEEINEMLNTAPTDMVAEGEEPTTQILVVDDNVEMADYLVQLFAGQFKTKKANGAQEALDILNAEIIELVVADVMMPDIDGVELCRRIKQERSTSHIPVILLSARIGVEDKLSGLNTGADDYIEKPFNPELLKARVKIRLEKIKELKEYYKREFLLQPKEVETVNEDEQFILELKNIVESNISDTGKIKLVIQEEMAMSKATLYRKLKSVTDYSLSEFIRVIRVKWAAQHLVTTQMSISEIAYAVGFNDLKYFRVCFESVFHMTPSDYRKSMQTPGVSAEL